jgi:hypothetical protein
MHRLYILIDCRQATFAILKHQEIPDGITDSPNFPDEKKRQYLSRSGIKKLAKSESTHSVDGLHDTKNCKHSFMPTFSNQNLVCILIASLQLQL